MFDFTKYKYAMTNSLAPGFSAASGLLDYYLKDTESKKRQRINEFNRNILMDQQIANENSIMVNSYLTNSALKAQELNNTMSIRRSSAEAIAIGAAQGMEGAALELMARQASFNELRAVGDTEAQIEANVQQAQLKIDASNQSMENQLYLNELKREEGPSIFNSFAKSAVQFIGAVDKAEKERQTAEYYALLKKNNAFTGIK